MFTFATMMAHNINSKIEVGWAASTSLENLLLARVRRKLRFVFTSTLLLRHGTVRKAAAANLFSTAQQPSGPSAALLHLFCCFIARTSPKTPGLALKVSFNGGDHWWGFEGDGIGEITGKIREMAEWFAVNYLGRQKLSFWAQAHWNGMTNF